MAIKSFNKLSPSEASSIFEALTLKIKQEENLSDKSTFFKLLFDLSRSKTELKSEIITFLMKFPESRLPLTSPALAEGLLKESHPEPLLNLFTKWAKSENKNLSKIVKNKIK